MNLREALLARLLADSAVTAVFGTSIHWVARPQTEGLPALVLQVIGGPPRDEDLDGVEAMREVRVQLDSMAMERARGGGGIVQACAGIDAAIAALLPEAELDGIVFWRGSAEEPRDLGELTETGFIHRENADLLVRYAKIS